MTMMNDNGDDDDDGDGEDSVDEGQGGKMLKM